MTREERADRPFTRRWLARLSFSFFIVALWLGWVGYRGLETGAVERWQAWVCLAAALMAFMLGVAGVRERHRG